MAWQQQGDIGPRPKKKGNYRDRTCRAENGIDFKLKIHKCL